MVVAISVIQCLKQVGYARRARLAELLILGMTLWFRTLLLQAGYVKIEQEKSHEEDIETSQRLAWLCMQAFQTHPWRTQV